VAILLTVAFTVVVAVVLVTVGLVVAWVGADVSARSRTDGTGMRR
jgi:hypothetical protein